METKRSLWGKWGTKTVVATALGAALFLVLFFYVKVPSPVSNTNFQIAYGLTTFFGALFGPISGFLVGFVGHALNDALTGYGVWWSWVIASGVAGFISGLAYKTFDLDHGEKPGIWFFVLNIVAHLIAWWIIAPGLDVLIYSESPSYVFLVQGPVAFVIDCVSALVVGSILVYAYSATRSHKDSLDKE